MTNRCPMHLAAAALAVVCAAATPLCSAAPPPEQPPEWLLAESPGAAGFGFGLGIDLSWEDLDRFANTAATTTVTTHDANGGTVTQVIPGDPALSNRKFDYRFDVKTGGGQAPVALPRFSLGRGVTIYPSLVFEAAITDVTFHFDDRRNPQDSTSVTARGASYGLGLEAVATLGRSNRWFLATGYRFRELPSLSLERSPPFDPFAASGQGSPSAVTHDQVRLDQETHLATLRVGRAFRDGRLNPYLGLRGRWTDLEFEDELDFRSPLGDETALTTRSRYESDSALAVAGVDAKLGGPLLGRAEVTFGDGDTALLLKTVVRLRPAGTPSGPSAAEGIAEAFDRLRRELEREAKELEPLRATQPELYVSKVLELLDRIEAEGVAVLLHYDYVALADWLRDRFDEARAAVRAAPASRADLRDLWPLPVTRPAVRLASLSGPAPPPPGGDTDEGDEKEAWYARALGALSLIFIRAKEGCLSVRFRFDVEPGRRDVTVIFYSKSAPGDAERRLPNREVELKIGSYTYCIEQEGSRSAPEGAEPCGPPRDPSLLFQCLSSDRPPGPNADCPLDIADPPVTRVHCTLATRRCELGPRDLRCADVDD